MNSTVVFVYSCFENGYRKNAKSTPRQPRKILWLVLSSWFSETSASYRLKWEDDTKGHWCLRVLKESYERQETAGFEGLFKIHWFYPKVPFGISRVHLCALVPTAFLEIALCQTCMFYIYYADTWVCSIGVHIKEGRLLLHMTLLL